jgi:hypothetical protein
LATGSLERQLQQLHPFQQMSNDHMFHNQPNPYLPFVPQRRSEIRQLPQYPSAFAVHQFPNGPIGIGTQFADQRVVDPMALNDTTLTNNIAVTSTTDSILEISSPYPGLNSPNEAEASFFNGAVRDYQAPQLSHQSQDPPDCSDTIVYPAGGPSSVRTAQPSTQSRTSSGVTKRRATSVTADATLNRGSLHPSDQKRGGRKPGTRLLREVKDKANQMREQKACWTCKLQRVTVSRDKSLPLGCH